jgi:capsid portal protein
MDKDGDKEESMKDAVKDKEEDTVDESIQRMREMAGIREAKKEVDEADMEEGNKFAHNVLKAKAAGKKEADLDGDGDMEKVRESIFSLTNQWKTYKG